MLHHNNMSKDLENFFLSQSGGTITFSNTNKILQKAWNRIYHTNNLRIGTRAFRSSLATQLYLVDENNMDSFARIMSHESLTHKRFYNVLQSIVDIKKCDENIRKLDKYSLNKFISNMLEKIGYNFQDDLKEKDASYSEFAGDDYSNDSSDNNY